MSRDDRWTAVYGAVRLLRRPALPSEIYERLHAEPDWRGSFAVLYTDLGRMCVHGWLVEHEVTDDQGRQRRAFTARAGGPPERTPAGSFFGLRPAYA